MQRAQALSSSARSSQASVVFLCSLFFLSGFAALLYQVIWQRLLAIFSGVDVYSVTIIVAAFMGGLGIGSLVGGHLADVVTDRRRLALFALSELCIALFALASKWIYYDLLYRQIGSLAASPALLAPVLFLSLLWPTFFMGMSLPLLARSLTVSVEAAAGTVGVLYGLNTLGAGIGSFVAAWVLIPALGFESSIHLGAGLNACCALGALVVIPRLAPREGVARRAEREPEIPLAATTRSELPFGAWAVVYALSGFIALSLEIVWFRLLAVLIKPSAFTFPNLLGVYVTGVALGTFLGIALVRRISAPGRTFFLLQTSVPIYAGLSLALLLLALDGSWLEGLRAHLAGYEAVNLEVALDAVARGIGARDLPAPIRTAGVQFLMLYFVVPTLLVLPATLMMGTSFPLLQKVVQNDRRLLGRRVGWLQASNIAGSMAGATITGWLLLGALGTAGTLRALIALGVLFLLLFLRTLPIAGVGRVLFPTLGLALWAGSLVLTPGPRALWSGLHGSDDLIFSEDETGLSVLKRARTPSGEMGTIVFVNGLGQSWIPYGGLHTLLGVMPVMLHPDPREVAVIGLGSGDTLFSAGGRPETRALTCFELIASQRETLERLQRQRPDAGLGSMLADPRIRLVVADGRATLVREGRRYDVIEADALRPNSAYAGNLYSYEYFEMLRRRLKRGGLAVTWSPTPRVVSTFVRVFPHVLHVHPILLGSNEPIVFDPEAIRARAADPFTRAYYARAGIDIVELTEEIVTRPRRFFGPGLDRSRIRDINTDLFPRDEYLVHQPPSRGR